MLGGLGLQLAGGSDVGHQRHVQEEAVVAADVVADLAGGLEERQGLDVADGAADLGDHDVDAGATHGPDPVLDLVGDVRDHLDRVTEVVAAALLGDHAAVDLAGRDVGDLVELGVEEALVVADVEVGLGAVVGDEHLAVLERVHRPGVDVEVGVELLHGHPETAGLEQVPQTGGGEALPETGGDASGDEHVLGGRVLHGLRAYPMGTGPSAPAAPKSPPTSLKDLANASAAVTRPAGPSIPSTVVTAGRLVVGAEPGEHATIGRSRRRSRQHDRPGRAGQTGDQAAQRGIRGRSRVVAEDHQNDRRPQPGGLNDLDERGPRQALLDGRRRRQPPPGRSPRWWRRRHPAEPRRGRTPSRRPARSSGSAAGPAGSRACRPATCARDRAVPPRTVYCETRLAPVRPIWPTSSATWSSGTPGIRTRATARPASSSPS